MESSIKESMADLMEAFVVQALSSLQQQMELLAHTVDQLEVRGRRKMLLFHGVPETSKEDTALVVTRVLNDQLKIRDCSTSDIRRCHRMGRKATPNRPRPILVKFQNLILRDKIWYSKTQLKGSGVTVSEFLIKSRHDAFMAARDKFGISNCWTKDGSVYILRPNGSRLRVLTVSEVHKTDQCQDASAKVIEKKPASTKTKRGAAVKK
ncbi:unnamed protein product [Parnassius mnemosyne]|uniref:Transposase n=1 Tax=Parnassius mnemosyne TaxID=213953 RepID=A0AAV1LNR6_9NEOP